MARRISGILCVMGVAAFCICASVVEAQIVTDGLVSYWTFDADTDGKTVKDVWGGNDGSISGDPRTVAGKIGKALEFDGDDHVNCGSDASLLLGDTDLSLALWVKFADSTGMIYLASTFSLQNGKYYQLWAQDGGIRWSIDDDIAKTQIESAPIELGQWYYAVGVREKGKETRLYVNGVLEVAAADQTGDITSDTPMIFADRSDGQRPLRGVLDEIGLYGRVLTDDEVLQNYKAETGPVSSVEPAGKLSLTWGEIKTAR